MKTALAIFMGLISGFLIYMMCAMLVIDISSPGGGISMGFVFALFFGGWAATSYFLLRGAQTVVRVAKRGFLIGACEWMIMILVGVIYSGRAVSSAAGMAGGSEAATAGAAIGGGIVAFLTGGVSVFMILICLAGFTIAHFMGKEMKAEEMAPTRKCPECAELIQQDARKCRFCGATISSSPQVA